MWMRTSDDQGAQVLWFKMKKLLQLGCSPCIVMSQEMSVLIQPQAGCHLGWLGASMETLRSMMFKTTRLNQESSWSIQVNLGNESTTHVCSHYQRKREACFLFCFEEERNL